MTPQIPPVTQDSTASQIALPAQESVEETHDVLLEPTPLSKAESMLSAEPASVPAKLVLTNSTKKEDTTNKVMTQDDVDMFDEEEQNLNKTAISLQRVELDENFQEKETAKKKTESYSPSTQASGLLKYPQHILL